MTSASRPIIGITMGDPSGIGPEVIVKALTSTDVADRSVPIVIADPFVIEDAIRIAKTDAEVQTVTDPNKVSVDRRTICVLQPLGCSFPSPAYGKVCTQAGQVAYAAIQKAVELACSGLIDAIVTAPISKEAMNAAGLTYSGHTEILARLTGTRDCAMLLVYDRLRVVHVTTHVPISKVPGLISAERILKVITLGHDGCKGLGIDRPRIAVAGLNPHASDGGLFGDEERMHIIPAIHMARSAGMDVEGPIPADTVFPKAAGGQFDLCVAMYHDQGHIPLKLIGFRFDEAASSINGVNITLGLPIIRTSVDHGTAFDIAGKGIACADSMVQAIEYAIKLAGKRPK